MLTALVLQLIQCVVILPERLGRNSNNKQNSSSSSKSVKKDKEEKVKENGGGEEEQNDPEAGMDRDVVVNNR